MSKKKVCILDPVSWNYIQLFESMGYEIVHTCGEADLICFTGGEDVSPAFYGHKKHYSTYSNLVRDKWEEQVFKSFGDKPKVGICRGGQFLNVMNGGTMYQDVTKHTFSHVMVDKKSGKEMIVSSTHHQMMKPGEEGEVVATAYQKGQRLIFDLPSDKFVIGQSDEDIEVVWYPKTRSLCFQPHPEFSSEEFKDMRTYFSSLVDQL